MLKIGINGIAGRIGKFAAYELIDLGEIIGAVNDLASTDDIVKSLAHRDGVHGTLDWKIEKIDENNIAINGNAVRINHERDPSMIKWGEDITIINECAGPFTDKNDANRHFNQYSPKLNTVIVSAPGKGMNTYVMGVNHTDYRMKENVISNASCTTKALAVPLKTIIDAGIQVHAVLMDTTHATTNTQKPLDFMSTYGALDTISSAKTGAAIATGEVIKSLSGIMDGFAMRVPTRDGSFANAYIVGEGNNLGAKYINEIFSNASKDKKYAGRIKIFDGKEISSTDIIGNTASSVIALSKTKSFVLPYEGKNGNKLALIGFVSGYDNERGPSRDLALLTKHVRYQNEWS
jgi:glyceraldehyde 3-phosphate dehydrogenase